MPRPVLLTIVYLLLNSSLNAADSARVYPFWNGRESIADYARRANLPPVKGIEIGNGVTMNFVLIPAVQYVMGTPPPDPPLFGVHGSQVILVFGACLVFALILTHLKFPPRGRRLTFSLAGLLAFSFSCSIVTWGATRWRLAVKQKAEYAESLERYEQLSKLEKPGHLETISKPFYLGKFEVTQAQYEAVTHTNPSQFKSPTNPVEGVNWQDSTNYCTALEDSKGVPVRLPTEAEWEFACRAGTVTLFNTGDTLSKEQANYNGNATLPVGSYKPNAWGLYDMHGNVWEWCHDWSTDYIDSAHVKGWILRGGAWMNDTDFCRSALRYHNDAACRTNAVGFRVAMSVEK